MKPKFKREMFFGFFSGNALVLCNVREFSLVLAQNIIFFDHLRILPQKYESGVKFKKKMQKRLLSINFGSRP